MQGGSRGTRRRRAARRITLALLVSLAVLGCEAIAGYNDVEPRPRDSGAAATGGNPGRDGTVADGGQDGREEAGDEPSEDGNQSTDASDASLQDAPLDHDAGPCRILTGNNACATVPRFTAAKQVVDGIGDEFCDIPAMVFDVDSCATMFPSEPPSMPEKVYLRIAWSTEAFHLHVHVVDPSVLVSTDETRLWDSDAVEIYIAGASGTDLKGSYSGSDYGGPIQIILSPPAGGYPTRGQAYLYPSATNAVRATINNSIFAGRLVADGYELELRYPWVAFSQTPAPGKKIAFDIAVNAREDADANQRQLQCIISNVYVDGSLACNYRPPGIPAQPYCDDRTWCQPELLP